MRSHKAQPGGVSICSIRTMTRNTCRVRSPGDRTPLVEFEITAQANEKQQRELPKPDCRQRVQFAIGGMPLKNNPQRFNPPSNFRLEGRI